MLLNILLYSEGERLLQARENDTNTPVVVFDQNKGPVLGWSVEQPGIVVGSTNSPVKHKEGCDILFIYKAEVYVFDNWNLTSTQDFRFTAHGPGEIFQISVSTSIKKKK